MRVNPVKRIDPYTTPTVVDVKIDLKAKLEGKGKDRRKGVAKQEAHFKALDESGFDILVDPVYEWKQSGRFLWIFGGRFTCRVKGFGGKYTNARPVHEAIKDYKGIDSSTVDAFFRLNKYQVKGDSDLGQFYYHMTRK